MSKKINIAIDGYSSCGKSTLTKQLAKELAYTYVDTGAMYRAVTLYFLRNNIDLEIESPVEEELKNIHLRFNDNGEILLNHENVATKIRTLNISNYVSQVASISAVRRFLVKEQQALATEQKGVIMDGRDIGTVVMPNAELKLFMTADKEIRVERRYNELLLTGKEITKDEVRKNLEHRDYVDSHRKDSPLSKAEDAILLDNTHLTREEQLSFVLKLVKDRVE